MSDYGNPDLYRTPRYQPEVASALNEFPNAEAWDDWDLAGLLTDVPHAYATKCGARFGIFCSTGTAGLHASLMALELLPGDEVLVPCMTFIRAVTPLVHLGLTPVLVDIDPDSGNLDPAAVLGAIGPKTRAIIVVHMWGISADLDSLLAICRAKGLYLIEDFSHAHYSKCRERYVGSAGDVSFASLQRKKTLSVGEGGLIVTSRPDVYERLQQITSPGSFKGSPNYNEFSGFGLNMRMSPFSVVVARTLLSRIDQIVNDRSRHVAEFSSMLAQFPAAVVPPVAPSYATVVSAYGYKPKLSSANLLEHLASFNARGRWRWSSFSYDHILASPFWRKSRAHYPFALQITPRYASEYPGYESYVQNRVSLAVPTVDAGYWTDDIRAEWLSDLKDFFPEPKV